LVETVRGGAGRRPFSTEASATARLGARPHGPAETGHMHTGTTHVHPFASTSMPLPDVVERESFKRFVETLPAAVVRAKGQVRFADRPGKMFVWNKIDGRNGLQLDECTPHAHSRPVALFIGVQLPLAQLAAQVASLERASAT
jgi:G3E family GTPase